MDQGSRDWPQLQILRIYFGKFYFTILLITLDLARVYRVCMVFVCCRSAGEDGVILQLDHREKHVCRSADNRVSLINLTAYIDANAEAKCIAVNPVRTEYIAVGANDPYARIYDRRMLKTFSSASNGG